MTKTSVFKTKNGTLVNLVSNGDLTKDILDDIKLNAPHNQSYLVPCDTETTGLNHLRDELRCVQFSTPWIGGPQSRKYFIMEIKPDTQYPNLMNYLQSSYARLVFHNAMFDLPFLMSKGFPVSPDNEPYIRCTRLVSKIVRTYAPGHSLADVVGQYCGVKMDKAQQTSAWYEFSALTEEQLEYAFKDIYYLLSVYEGLLDESNSLLKQSFVDSALSALLPNARLKFWGYDPAEMKLWGY